MTEKAAEHGSQQESEPIVAPERVIKLSSLNRVLQIESGDFKNQRMREPPEGSRTANDASCDQAMTIVVWWMNV